MDRPRHSQVKRKAVGETTPEEVVRIAEWLYRKNALPDNNVSSVQFISLVQLVQDIGDDLNIVSEQQLSRYLFTNGNQIQFKYDEIQESHQASIKTVDCTPQLNRSQKTLDKVRRRILF